MLARRFTEPSPPASAAARRRGSRARPTARSAASRPMRSATTPSSARGRPSRSVRESWRFRRDQRGQAGLDDTEDEMRVAAGNAEHDAPMLFAVMGPSKAHAAARMARASRHSAGSQRPRRKNQCRRSESGARRIASVQSDPHDSPSKRQNVTTLVSPHSSQQSVSSPSMKRARLNVGEDAGCRQWGQVSEKFRAPQRSTRCLSQLTPSSSATLRSNQPSTAAEHRCMTRKSGKESNTPVRFEWPRRAARVPSATGGTRTALACGRPWFSHHEQSSSARTVARRTGDESPCRQISLVAGIS